MVHAKATVTEQVMKQVPDVLAFIRQIRLAFVFRLRTAVSRFGMFIRAWCRAGLGAARYTVNVKLIRASQERSMRFGKMPEHPEE
jgi:hypothetical protein